MCGVWGNKFVLLYKQATGFKNILRYEKCQTI